MTATTAQRDVNYMWEFAGLQETEKGSLSAFHDPEEEEHDQQDPLVFRDEETSSVADEDHTKKRSHKTWALLMLLGILVLVIVIPIILLATDIQRSSGRLHAQLLSPDILAVSIDLAEKLPVVALEVSVPTSAFPKWTHLQPDKVVCTLFYCDDSLVVTITEGTTISTTDAPASMRTFLLNATLAGRDVAEVETFASVSWEFLTQQRTHIGPWSCHIHFDVLIANLLPWHHTTTESGYLDFGDKDEDLEGLYSYETTASPTGSSAAIGDDGGDGDVDDKDDDGEGLYSYETTASPTGSPAAIGDDGGDGDTMVPANQSSVVEEQQRESNKINFTMIWDDSPYDPEPSQAHSRDDNGDDGDHNDDDDITTTQNTIFIEQVTSDWIVLGVRLSLPESILSSVPQIHVRLPPVWVSAQITTHPQAFQVFLGELDLKFSPQHSDHVARAEVSCGSDGESCPWYSPLLDVLTDTLMSSSDNFSILSITVEADESFLETMVGTQHDMVLWRVQQALVGQRRHRHLKDVDEAHPLSSSGTHGRGLDEKVFFDCILMRDSRFGDIFELSWCMNLRVSEGVALDGHIEFYDFSGSAAAGATWQRVDDVFSLVGNALVDIAINDDNDANLDLVGSAALDLDQMTVEAVVNNTASWWPFLMALQASLDDAADNVLIFKLDNATFEGASESYVNANGRIKLDFNEETISMEINDTRLQAAMDGALKDNSLLGDWKIVFEDEDIMTGESKISARDNELLAQSRSDGLLSMSLNAVGVSSDEKLSFDAQEAQLAWDGTVLVNAIISLLYYDDNFSFEVAERKHDHRFYFSLEFDEDDADFTTFSGRMQLRIGGDDLFESHYEIEAGSDKSEETHYDSDSSGGGLEVLVFGSAGKHSFFLESAILWNSSSTTRIEYQVNDALFQVDQNVLMALSGSFYILRPDYDGNYAGALQMGTNSDAEVELESSLTFAWNDEEETLNAELGQLLFGITGATYIDATGEMAIDLDSKSMLLELHDDYSEEDSDSGFDLSISGSTVGNILTANVRDYTIVSDGTTLLDSSFQFRLNRDNTSIGYAFEELVSETTLALQSSAMTMGWDEYDEVLEALDFSIDQMTIVVGGDPWVRGGMDAGLDLVKSTMSLAMINNTTKLPMDFEFAISIDDDSQVDLSMMAMSSSPPTEPPEPAIKISSPPASTFASNATKSPVLVNSSFLISSLNGLDAAELKKELGAGGVEALREAYRTFVQSIVGDFLGTGDSPSVRRKLGTTVLNWAANFRYNRKLASTYLAESTEIYDFVDTPCLTADDITSISKQGGNRTCITVFGRYTILAAPEDDVKEVYQSFVKATQVSIAEGKLDKILQEVVSSSNITTSFAIEGVSEVVDESFSPFVNIEGTTTVDQSEPANLSTPNTTPPPDDPIPIAVQPPDEAKSGVLALPTGFGIITFAAPIVTHILSLM